MEDKGTHDTIVFQSNCLLDLLEDMIKAIPPSKLPLGDRPRNVPARQALHILQSFERCGKRGHRLELGPNTRYGRFGRRAEPDEIPSRKDILAYLKKVRGQFGRFIMALPEDFFTKPAGGKRGRFRTRLGKYIYLLRHNALHLGYMRDLMAGMGIRMPEFK